jgi:hypothetical protein
VILAAVLGFIFSAFGVLGTISLLFAGALFGGLEDQSDEAGFDGLFGAFAGIAIVIGIVVLAWTVVMIWGSVWALTGRSRVMLLVGGSIALALMLIGFLGSLGDENSTAGGIFFTLLLLLAALAIVVLLSMKPAANFFAAHRARRGR